MQTLTSSQNSQPEFLYSATEQTTKLALPQIWGFNLEITFNSLHHPQPLDWQSWQGKELANSGGFLTSPGLPLFNILSSEEVAKLPANLVALLEKVDWLAYELLQAAVTSQGAYELASSSPLLFIYLVLECKKHGVSRQDFTELVLLPRKSLAKFCQLNASKSTVKLLNKLLLASQVKTYQLEDFKQLLNNPVQLQRLSHVRQPSTNHLLFLSNYTSYFWPNMFSLVEEGGKGSRFLHVRSLVEDCQRLGASPANFRQIRSYAELNSLHNRLITQYNTANRNLFNREERIKNLQEVFGDYPSAPVAGNSNILPLTSWAELLDEGQEMHHCVGSYGKDVAQGYVFIYKVLQPQRLTLALAPRNKTWRIKEIRGYCNQQPIDEALAAVNTWLAKALSS